MADYDYPEGVQTIDRPPTPDELEAVERARALLWEKTRREAYAPVEDAQQSDTPS